MTAQTCWVQVIHVTRTLAFSMLRPLTAGRIFLTAINTQELQGRKQIAIVLPDQGKAFRQPVDFDGLKTVRRTLKAQTGFYRAFRFQSRGIRAPAPLRGLFFAGHI